MAGVSVVRLDRTSSIENEPRTLNLHQIQLARASPSSLINFFLLSFHFVCARNDRCNTLRNKYKRFRRSYENFHITGIGLVLRICMKKSSYLKWRGIGFDLKEKGKSVATWRDWNAQGLEPVVRCVHDKEEDIMMDEELEDSTNYFPGIKEIATAPF
ncbi:hypothetical protein A4A49_51529 [Nicotiana attenuata]|uniref:Uncharacterized protein n=1 Tax=Nicotiana attenuata TaxID=49451 RepID=A0A314LEH5_NICAT|nr:hypothetical protein A4A49_51529 [Nicotiana attenuata]